jgi:hypothetical protein
MKIGGKTLHFVQRKAGKLRDSFRRQLFPQGFPGDFQLTFL